jgi:hypothetical protein
LVVLLHVEQQGQEAVDLGQGEVVAVVALDERLALQIEDWKARSRRELPIAPWPGVSSLAISDSPIALVISVVGEQPL